MTQHNGASKRAMPAWRALLWGTIFTLLILPALAMRVTSEVDWTAAD